MKIMIHACPQRMWYVEGHLLPALAASGIGERQVKIWNDAEGRGNLVSCMEAFRFCGRYGGDTWHIQDDALPCRDFAARAAALEDEDGILCGFACGNFGPLPLRAGRVETKDMWYSFPCIRIPDETAGACAEWFFSDAQYREQFRQYTGEGKGDDSLFRAYLLERRQDVPVTNLRPNLAEHVDWLIGGTLVNPARRCRINRAAYWEDGESVRRLEKVLKENQT